MPVFLLLNVNITVRFKLASLPARPSRNCTIKATFSAVFGFSSIEVPHQTYPGRVIASSFRLK